ncbi:MAG TPA: YceI family protein [Pyrinomonadaceae bacterium]|nr:YceI family protein [Pyrinomonadaceae bacterium]
MKPSMLLLTGALVLGFHQIHPSSSTRAQTSTQSEQPQAGANASLTQTPSARQPSLSLRFRLDAKQSRFIVRAFSGGLLWFKGHDHLIAVQDFTGEAQVTTVAVSPASLHFTIRADSLVETREVFTEQQKQIINKEMREVVLETEKYPEIVFKSTDIFATPISVGQYQARIEGDLTLHGVTRHISIPAVVTLEGRDLRARGEFSIKRSDYNVKTASVAHGTVRVRDKLKFIFDIVAHQY